MSSSDGTKIPDWINLVGIGPLEMNDEDRPLDTPYKHWTKNKTANYCVTTIDWINRYYPNAQSIVETGCFVSDLLCDLPHIPLRIANDIQDLKRHWGHVKSVKFVEGDFTKIDWTKHLPNNSAKFDLLMSHFCIEHVKNPRQHAAEMLKISDNIIVTTTYKTKFGQTLGHINDPITLELLCEWFSPLNPREILISSADQLRRDNAWGITVLFTNKQAGPPIWMSNRWLERLPDYPFQDTRQA